jgi:K+-sensing histidine kinase KdpD
MGALLGVFLLGVLTRKPREGAAIAGVASGLSIVVGIHFYTPIAWTWYVLIGTITTFGVGLLASLFQGPAPLPMETAGVREPIGGLPHLPGRHATPEE